MPDPTPKSPASCCATPPSSSARWRSATPGLKERLEESAATYENVAVLVEQDPTGDMPESDAEH